LVGPYGVNDSIAAKSIELGAISENGAAAEHDHDLPAAYGNGRLRIRPLVSKT
jgi:hypothetical protein